MSPENFGKLTADIQAVFTAHKLDLAQATVSQLFAALDLASRNRAFDDKHPAFASGKWQRILPYDGRNFCWFYDGGLNDEHVKTALLKIRAQSSPASPVRSGVQYSQGAGDQSTK